MSIQSADLWIHLINILILQNMKRFNYSISYEPTEKIKLTYCQHLLLELYVHQEQWKILYLWNTRRRTWSIMNSNTHGISIPTTTNLLFLYGPIKNLKYYNNIKVPGRIRFFKISVPVAVAFIRHTLEVSRAVCPWSPHSLK